jgi:hypothetical protein
MRGNAGHSAALDGINPAGWTDRSIDFDRLWHVQRPSHGAPHCSRES